MYIIPTNLLRKTQANRKECRMLEQILKYTPKRDTQMIRKHNARVLNFISHHDIKKPQWETNSPHQNG